MRLAAVIGFLEDHLPRTLHHLGLIREGEVRRVESAPGGALFQSSHFYSLFAMGKDPAEKLLDMIAWDRPVGFSALPAQFADQVVARGTVSWRHRFWLYYLPPDAQAAPPPPHVEPLRPEDAPRVDKYWPYGGSSSLEYIEERIRRGPTAALRTEDQLVAWALTHPDGAMGFLHVVEGHRRRGVATTLTNSLVAQIRDRGATPFVHISVSNTPSITLVESLGMVRVEQAEWLMLNEPESA
jgi:ribosomal protein S18 acetylase RimI-like enzyme